MKEVTELLRQKAITNGPEYLVGREKPNNNLVLNKKGEPIRILMLAAHTCIRVIKESIALQRRGYIVDVFAGKLSYGMHNFDRVYMWDSMNLDVGLRQFKGMLPVIKDIYDIYHYHNEPDFPVALMYHAGVTPIVLDVHDLDSVRQNMLTADEYEMFKYAAGTVQVSKPVHDWAIKTHNYRKPSTILYSFCNDELVDYNGDMDQKRHGIVYEGGANPPSYDAEMGESFRYRSLYPLCKQIVEMGNELHMFIGNSDAVGPYSDIGAVIYPPTDYEEMMHRLVQFKWGLVAFNNADKTQRQTNMTLTNKMFEYLAAGMPVIVFGADESARIATELGVGICLDKLEDLGSVEEKFGKVYPQLKANVDRVRKELLMENNIWHLENLYREVLSKNVE